MSAFLLGVGTSLPQHRFDLEDCVESLKLWYSQAPGRPELPLAKAEMAFRNAGVSNRYSVTTVDKLLTHRPLGEKNRAFIQESVPLAESAIKSVLDESSFSAEDIDLLITTSCTGFSIPALDATLINRLPFRSNVKRLPVTELGCAAGVSSLRLAMDYLKAYPSQAVLTCSVELATLTFQPTDYSADHIISSAIFGDGAGAAILVGPDHPRSASGQMQINGNYSTFFPNTEDFMGFDLEETGFHIFLSPRIPAFVKRTLVPEVQKFLERVDTPTIQDWLVHPGGPKILDAIEDSLGIQRGSLVDSRLIFQNVGNLSSATIYFIISKFLSRTPADGREVGILAVGPGFQMELVTGITGAT